MDLLSLILVFLALAVCVSIGYIAWELTSEKPPRGDRPSDTSTTAEPSPSDEDRD